MIEPFWFLLIHMGKLVAPPLRKHQWVVNWQSTRPAERTMKPEYLHNTLWKLLSGPKTSCGKHVDACLEWMSFFRQIYGWISDNLDTELELNFGAAWGRSEVVLCEMVRKATALLTISQPFLWCHQCWKVEWYLLANYVGKGRRNNMDILWQSSRIGEGSSNQPLWLF